MWYAEEIKEWLSEVWEELHETKPVWFTDEVRRRASETRERNNEERSDEYYCCAPSLRSSLVAQRAVIALEAEALTGAIKD